MSSLCVGRNIGDSLDFGVTTFLYDGLFHHVDGQTNILHALFPLTARRLGEGLIVGRERCGLSVHSCFNYSKRALLMHDDIVASSYCILESIAKEERCCVY